MAAPVDIANLALTKLGAEPLTSLTEDNDRAVLFNALYAHVRDSVLEEHPWEFALRRDTLASATPSPLFGFTNRYALPGDVLKVEMTDDETNNWIVEDKHIHSDRSSMEVLSIVQITDTARFSPLFVEALSDRLASEMALGITGKESLVELHWNKYLAKMKSAKTRSSQAGTPPIFEPDDLIDARFS